MSYKSSPLEILVIEDQYAYCELIKSAIEDGNFRSNIHILNDGLEAMEFLRKEGKFQNAPTPDFILLDIHLPKVSGLEILKTVKTDKTLNMCYTPVIVISASDSPEDINQAYDSYANAYVFKSSDAKQFLNNFKAIESFWMDIARLPSDDFSQ